MNKTLNWITVNSFMGILAVVMNLIFITRILNPIEIGVFALANVIILFSQTLTGLSFSSALIKFKSNKSYYKTAWTVNLIIGITTSITLFILIPIIINKFFISYKEYLDYFIILIVLIPINAAKNVGVIELYKSNNQIKLAILGGFSEVLKQIIIIACIVFFNGLKGLFYGVIIYSILNLVFTYVIAPIKIGFSLNYDAFKKLYKFSVWLHLKNILQFLSNQIDTMILGSISQINTLGYYNRARVIANLPKLIMDRINTTYLYPRLCELDENNQNSLIHFPNLIIITAKIIFAFVSFYLIFGKILIKLFLGFKWLAIDNFIVPLFIATIINSLAITINSLQRSKGKTKSEFISLLVKVISFLIFTPLLFNHFNVKGLAYSILASSITFILYLIIFENKDLFNNINLKGFLTKFIPIGFSYVFLMIMNFYDVDINNSEGDFNFLLLTTLIIINAFLFIPIIKKNKS